MPEFEYCRECKHILPADADECPHCGERRRRQPSGRQSYSKAIVLIALAVGVLIAAGVLVFVMAGTP